MATYNRASCTDRSLEAVFFHAAVEGSAGEAEGFGGVGYVAGGAGEGFADEDGLDGFEGEVVEVCGGDAGGGGGDEAEVGGGDAR